MNHPKNEEWLLYIEGAATPEDAGRLAEHLQNCPQCAVEIQGWQRTITKLEALPWPDAQPVRRRWQSAVVKWGIAALFMLSVGFAVGRLSAFNSTALRATLANDLRGQLRQEFKADLLAALAPDEQAARDEVQKELRAGFQAALVRNANASTTERQSVVQEILHVVAEGRDEDQRNTQALLLSFQQKEAADHFGLRKDIETLATTADDRLQLAHWQLTQLAVDTRAGNRH